MRNIVLITICLIGTVTTGCIPPPEESTNSKDNTQKNMGAFAEETHFDWSGKEAEHLNGLHENNIVPHELRGSKIDSRYAEETAYTNARITARIAKEYGNIQYYNAHVYAQQNGGDFDAIITTRRHRKCKVCYP
ncbi:MAG: hypothetical protein JRE23_12860 [Deltaproteobacteria bacterium]|nr:hypothetical protein [Deltaproteobacteria bacterium]